MSDCGGKGILNACVRNREEALLMVLAKSDVLSTVVFAWKWEI